MCVLNDLDRFHLVGDVIDRVPKLGARAAYAKQAIRDKLIEHKEYIARHGEDMPEIAGWAWGQEVVSDVSPRQRLTTSEREARSPAGRCSRSRRDPMKQTHNSRTAVHRRGERKCQKHRQPFWSRWRTASSWPPSPMPAPFGYSRWPSPWTAMPILSAGLLPFRRLVGPEVLLGHMGGPFWARKEEGAWSIPKGLPLPDENLLAAACRETREETGLDPTGPFLPLTRSARPAARWSMSGQSRPTATPRPCAATTSSWNGRPGPAAAGLSRNSTGSRGMDCRRRFG